MINFYKNRLPEHQVNHSIKKVINGFFYCPNHLKSMQQLTYFGRFKDILRFPGSKSSQSTISNRVNEASINQNCCEATYNEIYLVNIEDSYQESDERSLNSLKLLKHQQFEASQSSQIVF